MGRYSNESVVVRKSLFIIGIAAYLLCVMGCMHYRDSYFVSTRGDLRKIKTQNRYTVVDLKHKTTTANADIVQSNTYEMQFSNESLKRFQPDVFSDDGIRFVVNWRLMPSDDSGIPSLISLLAFHLISTSERNVRYTVDVLDNPDARTSVDMCSKYDSATAILPVPTPLLFYIGDAAAPEGNEDFTAFTKHYIKSFLNPDGVHNSRISIHNEIYAYAIATALKKMEDDGLIKDIRAKHEKTNEVLQQTLDDKFEIEDFRKDGNCEYRYAFTLKRRGGGGISLKDSREVRRALRLMIRDDYKLSYPDVPIASLIVDFPEFSQRGGIIKGRAAVLSLNVKSLRYDPHARKGEIHICIGENQLEDARLYARKNIASLVRDKNIALDAREIPPAATFYLSGEAVKDDILEITFKTE